MISAIPRACIVGRVKQPTKNDSYSARKVTYKNKLTHFTPSHPDLGTFSHPAGSQQTLTLPTAVLPFYRIRKLRMTGDVEL